ncbi:hypothetical protein D3P09_03275 [Paenibacillus pinisoli]|uniref:Uncharacterized protein n=1 Tax=Paenibacillus pinisoli TaxID=1276110 RepID=A0A3A6PIQ2_9BACL|nr:hypothetical protein D3P09_03275 [Paenibacillus pinisoli]
MILHIKALPYSSMETKGLVVCLAARMTSMKKKALLNLNVDIYSYHSRLKKMDGPLGKCIM